MMKRIGVSLLLLAAVLVSSAGSQVEDCIAAVVNKRIITRIDLRIAERFRLYSGDEGEGSLERLRDRLVLQKLVVDMAREQASPGSGEIAAAVDALVQALGPEGFQRGLEEFGLEEIDLRPYVEEMLIFRNVIASRFSQSAPVTLQEIEAYYQNVFVPSEEKGGTVPPPVIQVLDRIEALIQEQKRQEQVSTWIGNLKTQADIRINRDCLQ
jgi:hypothetical protein